MCSGRGQSHPKGGSTGLTAELAEMLVCDSNTYELVDSQYWHIDPEPLKQK